MVVDSQREFETNLGRAVDALKLDYPELLTRDPDWRVYHPKIEAIDPTGVRMTGLENYKMAFGFVHGVVKWFYCEDRSGMTSVRVGYDWARKCIRCVVCACAYAWSRHIPSFMFNFRPRFFVVILPLAFPFLIFSIYSPPPPPTPHPHRENAG